MNEIQKAAGLVRFKVSKHGILYTKINPENSIEAALVRFFMERFSKFIIVIASKRGCFIGGKNEVIRIDDEINNVVKKFEESLPLHPYLKDIDDNDYYESYYESQLIPERRNTKRFLHELPKKYYNQFNLNHELFASKGSKSLKEFL